MFKRFIIAVLFPLLLAGCPSMSVDGLTAGGQIYGAQAQLTHVYGPSIRGYAAQDFCDAGATPPVVVACADAKTVIVLNTAMQEVGSAIKSAQRLTREANALCSEPNSQPCAETSQLLAFSLNAMRSALAVLSSRYIAAGLDQ